MLLSDESAFYFEPNKSSKKPITMKTLTKKFAAIRPVELVRELSISAACIAFIALMLYVLINSPA